MNKRPTELLFITFQVRYNSLQLHFRVIFIRSLRKISKSIRQD